MTVACKTEVEANHAEKGETGKQNAIDVYEFPVQPGTPEWKSLKSVYVMRQALQIPKNVLDTISTEGLVDTCLNYPLLLDITAFDDQLYGLETVISRFNGLQELVQRKESGRILLKRYKAMQPDCEKGLFLPILYLEMLLSYRAILAELDSDTLRTLLQESLRIFHIRESCGQITAAGTSLFLMCSVLEHAEYLPLKNEFYAFQTTVLIFIENRICKRSQNSKIQTFPLFLSLERRNISIFLQSGGRFVDTELLKTIVKSVEQYLLERR